MSDLDYRVKAIQDEIADMEVSLHAHDESSAICERSIENLTEELNKIRIELLQPVFESKLFKDMERFAYNETNPYLPTKEEWLASIDTYAAMSFHYTRDLGLPHLMDVDMDFNISISDLSYENIVSKMRVVLDILTATEKQFPKGTVQSKGEVDED